MTYKVLPPCSIKGCDHAAGAIMDGALYCGTHAAAELNRRLAPVGASGRKPATA